MKETCVIYWCRRDFRLRDNPALSGAIARAQELSAPLVVLFIVEDYMTESQWGYPQKFMIAHALPAFFKQFASAHVVRGRVVEVFDRLMHAYDGEVFVNEDVHPDFFAQIDKLRQHHVRVQVVRDQLTISKDVRTGSGGIYSVFTPFKNAVWEDFVSAPELPPCSLDGVRCVSSRQINTLCPTVPHATSQELLHILGTRRSVEVGGMHYDIDQIIPNRPSLDMWHYTEADVLGALTRYIESGVDTYDAQRDDLGADLTSKMSHALAWGLVSTRCVLAIIRSKYAHVDFTDIRAGGGGGARVYISELIWREFYKYVLFHHPRLLNEEFQEKYRHTLSWVTGKTAHTRFEAWMRGQTGYDIVDAAMMQLAHTGWMHNRARMIVASVLTKHLGIDWRWGQEYFRAMLIDLDDASNNGGWQWAASVGVDPKPMRIFNPYIQAQRYDAHAVYRRAWLPDGRTLDEISPIVEHAQGRADALVRYKYNNK